MNDKDSWAVYLGCLLFAALIAAGMALAAGSGMMR